MTNDAKVIVNQLGFRNGSRRKLVILNDLPDNRGIMGDCLVSVAELNGFSMYALNDPRQHPFFHQTSASVAPGDFGRWLVADISRLDRDGVYQAHCGNNASPVFVIRDDLWLRLLPECIRYFQIQSCGRMVVGWHEACHLDDGHIHELDRYLPAAGGWHDAGDFRKWATSTALNAIALLVGHRFWAGREAELGIEPGILLAEALQGVHYFLGIQDEATGALFQNIGGGREAWHDNLDNRYTDNLPRSGDERRIWPTPWARPAGKFTTLFALYANALRATHPDLADRCLAAARRSITFDLSEGTMSADALQWRAWGFLELWRHQQRDEDKHAALDALQALLTLQVTDFIGGQESVRGFFRQQAESTQYHRKHIGADYPIWVIAEFLREWPAHPQAERWREAIRLWADDYALVFAARNPFGLLPYALYHDIPEDHRDCTYRQLGDHLYFRYFIASRRLGSNARLALSAVAFAAAAQALDRPELLDHGYRLLEWIIGANPFEISMMNGVGITQPCALSFQMGNIPGGVTLGVGGDEEDMPWYTPHRSATDEYYGYQTSHFTWALLALQHQAR